MKKNKYEKYLPEVREYMSIVQAELEKTGKMEAVDCIAIDMLASYLQEWLQCEEIFIRDGALYDSDRGNKSPNPAEAMMNRAKVQAQAIMREYGLTALSRKKLNKGEETDDYAPPILDFLDNNG